MDAYLKPELAYDARRHYLTHSVKLKQRSLALPHPLAEPLRDVGYLLVQLENSLRKQPHDHQPGLHNRTGLGQLQDALAPRIASTRARPPSPPPCLRSFGSRLLCLPECHDDEGSDSS